MQRHKPGIYFSLPEAEYHADPSLSKSGITTLLDGPEQYWFESWMNPDKPPEERKDHIERGNLWHCRILEREHFEERYAVASWIEDGFSDNHRILRTIHDMKVWLDEHNIPYKSSWNKDEYEDLVEEHADETVFLWDRFMEAERLDAEADGKTLIYSKDVLADMLYAEARVLEHPYFSKVVSGGYAEVSIFWVDSETGIPMKCRVDKLKPQVILDYKTLTVRRTKGIDKCILDAIKYERYDIQAAMYTIGVAHAVNMINDGSGVIEGDVSGEFIDEFRQRPEKPFGFIFQQAEKPCAVRGRKVTRRGGDTYNAFGAGLYFMQRGIQLYEEYWKKYKTSRWIDDRGMEEVRDDEIYYYY